MMSGPYDLVEVKVMGYGHFEVCHGRPIEWDKEPFTQDGKGANGKFITPTKFMLTCPKCAGRLDFGPDDIAEDTKVICSLCDPYAALSQRARNIKAREGAKETEKKKEKPKEEPKEISKADSEKLAAEGITQEKAKKYGVTLIPETTKTATDVVKGGPDIVVNFDEKKLRDPLTADYDKSNLEAK